MLINNLKLSYRYQLQLYEYPIPKKNVHKYLKFNVQQSTSILFHQARHIGKIFTCGAFCRFFVPNQRVFYSLH